MSANKSKWPTWPSWPTRDIDGRAPRLLPTLQLNEFCRDKTVLSPQKQCLTRLPTRTWNSVAKNDLGTNRDVPTNSISHDFCRDKTALSPLQQHLTRYQKRSLNSVAKNRKRPKRDKLATWRGDARLAASTAGAAPRKMRFQAIPSNFAAAACRWFSLGKLCGL